MTARDVRIQCKIYGDTLGYVENKQLHVATIEKAMDTYARQEAMDFARWYADEVLKIQNRHPDAIDMNDIEKDQELYDLYQQQKQK